MARFYLDQNVASGIGGELQNFGHEATHARQLGLEGATDATHLLTAVQLGCVLISDDQDFLALHAAWREWPVAWQVSPAPVHHGILVINQGQMGGSIAAARHIHAQVMGGPPSANTLWHWTLARGWVAL